MRTSSALFLSTLSRRRPMKLFRSTLVVGALVVSACRESTGPRPAPETPLTALPRALSASETKIVSASNEFAFDLFRTGNVAQHKSNVFISPLSASMALGMTANGANGTTYDEMRTALRLSGASLSSLCLRGSIREPSSASRTRSGTSRRFRSTHRFWMKANSTSMPRCRVSTSVVRRQSRRSIRG